MSYFPPMYRSRRKSFNPFSFTETFSARHSVQPVFEQKSILPGCIQRNVVAGICMSDYAHGWIIVQNPLQSCISCFASIGNNHHACMDGIANSNSSAMVK
jgi:hypothetical protein